MRPVGGIGAPRIGRARGVDVTAGAFDQGREMARQRARRPGRLHFIGGPSVERRAVVRIGVVFVS